MDEKVHNDLTSKLNRWLVEIGQQITEGSRSTCESQEATPTTPSPSGGSFLCLDDLDDGMESLSDDDLYPSSALQQGLVPVNFDIFMREVRASGELYYVSTQKLPTVAIYVS